MLFATVRHTLTNRRIDEFKPADHELTQELGGGSDFIAVSQPGPRSQASNQRKVLESLASLLLSSVSAKEYGVALTLIRIAAIVSIALVALDSIPGWSSSRLDELARRIDDSAARLFRFLEQRDEAGQRREMLTARRLVNELITPQSGSGQLAAPKDALALETPISPPPLNPNAALRETHRPVPMGGNAASEIYVILAHRTLAMIDQAESGRVSPGALVNEIRDLAQQLRSPPK